jgi:hypothetical protein
MRNADTQPTEVGPRAADTRIEALLVAIELRIARAIDFAHAASAEQ